LVNDDVSQNNLVNRRKRTRIEEECQSHQTEEQPAAADSLSPSKENRGKKKLEYVEGTANNLPTEMKDMYTNVPASSISTLPEPFRTAVKNSRLWTWERSQEPESLTTGCLAALFPKDYRQDVSFTIWCGHDDGYQLIDVFGLQHAMSS